MYIYVYIYIYRVVGDSPNVSVCVLSQVPPFSDANHLNYIRRVPLCGIPSSLKGTTRKCISQLYIGCYAVLCKCRG